MVHKPVILLFLGKNLFRGIRERYFYGFYVQMSLSLSLLPFALCFIICNWDFLNSKLHKSKLDTIEKSCLKDLYVFYLIFPQMHISLSTVALT